MEYRLYGVCSLCQGGPTPGGPALIEFAFQKLGCVHLEMMDRNLTVRDLDGLGVQHRVYRGFEIDLTPNEDELFSNMTSACRRCIRKAEKEGVSVEEAHDLEFAEEYYAQLKDVFAKQSLVPTYDIERVRQLIRHMCIPQDIFSCFGLAIARDVVSPREFSPI